MLERANHLPIAAIMWTESFKRKAYKATEKFEQDFNICESLNLTEAQEKVYLAYFAHYWVLKTNIDTARRARNPKYEQYLKIPFLSAHAQKVYAMNDGADFAADLFLALARRFATELQDGTHPDLRNAANIISSIYLSEEPGQEELGQRIDRALSRIKIPHHAGAASQVL